MDRAIYTSDYPASVPVAAEIVRDAAPRFPIWAALFGSAVFFWGTVATICIRFILPS